MIGSLIIVVVLILPFGAFAAQDYSSNGETETVNTIDELVNNYSDTNCRKCHQRVYEEWEKSYHSQ